MTILCRSTRGPERKTGTSRSRSFDEQYFSTMAPIVVGNHVLVGTGNDLDMPGFLQSFDPETGKLQWKFYTVPMKPATQGSRRGQASTPRGTAAGRHGFPASTIPKRISTSSGRAIRLLATPASAVRATTCLRVR